MWRYVVTEQTPSIFAAVLADGGAYPRYHPLLEERQPKYADLLRSEGQTLLGALRGRWFRNHDDHHKNPSSVQSVEVDAATGTATVSTTGDEGLLQRVVANTTLVVVPATTAGARSTYLNVSCLLACFLVSSICLIA